MLPICLTCFGIIILSIIVSEKAQLPIISNLEFSWNIICFNDLHSPKHLFEFFLTELGIVIDSKLFDEKAYLPKNSTSLFSQKLISNKLQLSNAKSSIFLT